MPNEHNAFDLSNLVRDMQTANRNTPLVDLSGKPPPKGVSVILNSGVTVQCEVKYSGTAPNTRLFTVLAEIDWENYHPMILSVAEMPRDVEFRFRIPGLDDATANRVAADLVLQPHKIIEVT